MCDWMAYSAGLLAKELAMSISFSPIGSQSLNGICVCVCVCVYGMNLKYALCWHIHISVHSVLCQCYWAIQRSWFAGVNALCNLSRKKFARGHSTLPGRFLSRCCFTLCLTVEVETRIAKQYKCQYCCNCKNYRGKGMESENKVSLRRFFG